jgi:hypothetical protein
MPYSLHYDRDIDCIIAVFKDSIQGLTMQEITHQVVSLCREKGCWRILNDLSAASIDMSMMHLFDYIEIINNSSETGTAKNALLFPANFYDSRILGTTAHNKGDNLRIFFDVAEAKEWLLGNEQKP